MNLAGYEGLAGWGRTQRKDIYIEHRAGKAARLASWRKMTQMASFVGDGNFRVFPMRAHFPWNETLDSLSTLTSYVLHLPSQVKSPEQPARGQWGIWWSYRPTCSLAGRYDGEEKFF